MPGVQGLRLGLGQPVSQVSQVYPEPGALRSTGAAVSSRVLLPARAVQVRDAV